MKILLLLCSLGAVPPLVNTAVSVDGNWGPFSPYSACSVTCGSGVRFRKRDCNSPPPSVNPPGLECLLASGGRGSADLETESCQIPCTVPAVVTSSTVRELSPTQTVKEGMPYMYYCTASGYPEPDIIWRVNGVELTRNDNIVYRLPLSNPTRVEKRVAFTTTFTLANNNQVLACGAQNGVGENAASLTLRVQRDGGLTQWSAYSTCSRSCGGGYKMRTRDCNAPAPANGGADCAGPLQETLSCGTAPCPVNGGWTVYGPWSQCSVTCGAVATQTRSRSCTAPVPSLGGIDCIGDARQTRFCLGTAACPVNGRVSDWADYGPCSVTCGQGVQVRKRTCTNPPPSNYGLDCPEHLTESRTCTGKLAICPVLGPCDCNFEVFVDGEQSACGWLTEQRDLDPNVDDPAWVVTSGPTFSENTGPSGDVTFPDGSGHYIYVDGSRLQAGRTLRLFGCEKLANVRQCLTFWLHMWDHYNYFMGALRVYVDQGGVERQVFYQSGRIFNDPIPWLEVFVDVEVTAGTPFRLIFEVTAGLAFTSDIAIDEVRVTDGQCTGPVRGDWGAWGLYTPCNPSCGPGIQYRSRDCNDPGPRNGGKGCTDALGVVVSSEVETKTCNAGACPINGEWSNWETTPCRITCGLAYQISIRECNSPPPQNGGRNCVKDDGTVATQSYEEKQLLCQLPPCIARPLVTTDMVPDFEVNDGDRVSHSCTATAYPKATFAWYRTNSANVKTQIMDGIETSESNLGTELAVTSKLVVGDYRLSMWGKLECVATNIVGSDKKESMIKIRSHPRTNLNMPPDALVPDTVDMFCDSTAYPAPSIEWFFNGFPIMNGADAGNYLILPIEPPDQIGDEVRVKSNLRITQVSLKDTGVWSCKGVNVVDASTSLGLIQVRSG